MNKLLSRLRKPKLRSIALVFSVGLILFGVTGVVLSFRGSSSSDSITHLPVDDQLRSVLAQSTTNIENLRTVDSSLGFKVTYDPSVMDGQGQTTDASSDDNWVSGMTYTEEDLYERRDYSIVKFRPKTDEGESLFDKPQLTVLTNIRKSYWDNKLNQSQDANKAKLDIFVDSNIKTQIESGYSVADTQDTIINGVEYRVVNFDYNSTSFGVSYKNAQRFYFTVQNDRPYYASISNIQNDSSGYIAQFETVINTITFEGLDQDKLASSEVGVSERVLAATDPLPAGVSNMPSPLDTGSLIDVVARNQIAVVRIGTIYCTSIELILPGGTVGGRVSDACAAGIGSGSIVTSDGYVATNGHVVRMGKESALSGYIGTAKDVDDLVRRIDPVLAYLVQRGTMTSAQKNSLISAVKLKDPKALQAVLGLAEAVGEDRMIARNDAYSYVVQLSNDPIRIKDLHADKLEFTYTNSNITARFVADNYDSSISVDDISQSTKSDVALLKMEGQFPVVSLGSVDTVKPRDQLIAIGFPMFVDKGITTTQQHTVPSVTQGYAEGVRALSLTSTYKLVFTNVPIAQGNSGGPMFSGQGAQIGLNTYSILPCTDGKCFGKGIARDINDLKQLAKANGISLSGGGSLTQEWGDGIDALKNDDYDLAAQKFNKVSNEYHGNYLALALRDVAVNQTDGETVEFLQGYSASADPDTQQQTEGSAGHLAKGVAILGTVYDPKIVRLASGFMIVAGGAMLVLAFAKVHFSKRAKKLTSTEGLASTAEVAAQPPSVPVVDSRPAEPTQQDPNKPM